MPQQWTANFCAAWLCLLQPAACFAAGVYVGRHGLRRTYQNIVIRLGLARWTYDGS